MNKWNISGADRSKITVSNLYFHSRIIRKNSPGRKKIFNSPLMLYRRNSGESIAWRNKLFSPIHFHFHILRQVVFPVSREKIKAEDQLLQLTARKENGARDASEKVTTIQDIIKGKELTVWEIVRSNQTKTNTLLINENLSEVLDYPIIMSSVRKKPLGRVFPSHPTATFFVMNGESQNANKKSLKDAINGKPLSGRKAIFENISTLDFTSFSELAVNTNSNPTVPSGSAFGSPFNSEPALESSPGKISYSQASSKKLALNSAVVATQELEREVTMIKEELLRAEKVSQANYSSIYSKMEEELKQKLEINRISEHVIQQIVWRLKIEKERRGLL